MDENDNWNEFIEPTLMAYHITKHFITGVILFVLIYGREAVLLIDEMLNMTIRDCMMQIVEEVPHIREQACLMIQQSQEQMVVQDLKKEKRFRVGKKVLC